MYGFAGGQLHFITYGMDGEIMGGYDYQTSLEAWLEIQPNISGRRKQVFLALYELREATNMEIAKHLGWSINRVTPRVLELREMGVVEQSCIRQCDVTKNNARAWKISITGMNAIAKMFEKKGNVEDSIGGEDA